MFFSCMFFKAKYQSEKTTEESFTDEMNTLHCCETLLNTTGSKSYFFLSLDVLIFSAFFSYSIYSRNLVFFLLRLLMYRTTEKSKAVLSFSDFSLSKNLALKLAPIRMSRFCLMMLNLVIVKTAVPKESLSKILGSCDPPF